MTASRTWVRASEPESCTRGLGFDVRTFSSCLFNSNLEYWTNKFISQKRIEKIRAFNMEYHDLGQACGI